MVHVRCILKILYGVNRLLCSVFDVGDKPSIHSNVFNGTINDSRSCSCINNNSIPRYAQISHENQNIKELSGETCSATPVYK